MFSGKVIREGNLLNLVLSHGMSYALETWIVLKAIWYLILTNVVGDRGYWELISETYMINVALSKETYHFFSHRPKWYAWKYSYTAIYFWKPCKIVPHTHTHTHTHTHKGYIDKCTALLAHQSASLSPQFWTFDSLILVSWNSRPATNTPVEQHAQPCEAMSPSTCRVLEPLD
jgi:hypothetical protein